MFKSTFLVTSASMLFATLSLRALFFRNIEQVRSLFARFETCLHFADELIEIESLFGDVHVEGTHETFHKPLINIRIDHFVNDDHCEAWTRFKKDELRDLIENQLALDEYIFVHNTGRSYFRFHSEEIFIYVLSKLAFGDPHAFMADLVFGGEAQRWGKGCDYVLRILDETYGNLVNINSLNIWVDKFPEFAEVLRLKYCYLWEK